MSEVMKSPSKMPKMITHTLKVTLSLKWLEIEHRWPFQMETSLDAYWQWRV